MRVRCTHRHGDPIPDDVLALGNTPTTRFSVTFGREYIVYAVALWDRVLHYLVLDDQTFRPDWHPAFLFQVTNGRLPSSWFYANWRQQGLSIEAVWGYEELVTSAGRHYEDLIEREQEALRVFEVRRREIDAENAL